MGRSLQTSAPTVPTTGSGRRIDMWLDTWSTAFPLGETAVAQIRYWPGLDFGSSDAFTAFSNALEVVRFGGRRAAQFTASNMVGRQQMCLGVVSEVGALELTGPMPIIEQQQVTIWRAVVGVPVGGYEDGAGNGNCGVLMLAQKLSAAPITDSNPFASSSCICPGFAIVQDNGVWTYVVRREFASGGSPPDIFQALPELTTLHPNGTLGVWDFIFYPSTADAPAKMQFKVNGVLILSANYGSGPEDLGPGYVNANNQQSDGTAMMLEAFVPSAASTATLYCAWYEFISGINEASTFPTAA
jgi:hypothetical protein